MIRALALGASLALVALAACAGPKPREIPATSTRYDALPLEETAEFTAARALLLGGDARASAPRFERLARRSPDNVMLAIWWQEAEIARARSLAPNPAELDPARVPEAVRTRFLELARDEPSACACILAARIETDARTARTWLERSQAIDPRSPWPEYSRAWLALSASEWADARLAIARSLALDAGHVWTHRLEAWMEAHDGRPEAAAAILDGWLERTQDDPRIDPRTIAEARLDRAVLALHDDDPAGAREALESDDAALAPAWRRASIQACIEAENGEVEAALREARAAHAAAPDQLLPAVQIALLLEEHARDTELAIAAWEEVLQRARTSDDLLAALESTRARVRLERLRRARSGRP